MTETTEEAILLAIETREELFSTLREILPSENYLDVLMEVEEGQTQSEIADSLDIGPATVSRAISELQENELVTVTDNGYKKSLPVLAHPIIQHYFHEEVREDE